MAETRLFRVRFSFTGTDAVQLTVKKDEIVTANANASLSEDWILVETTHSPRKRGYIPTSYVKPLAPGSESKANSNLSSKLLSTPVSSAATSTQVAVPTTAVSAATTTTLAPSPASSFALTPRRVLPPRIGLASTVSSPSPARTRAMQLNLNTQPAPLNETCVECSSRYDQYFKAVNKAREEASRAIAAAMDNASKELAAGRDDNKMLRERIADLQTRLITETSRAEEKFAAQQANLVSRGLLKPSQQPQNAGAPTSPPATPASLLPMSAAPAVSQVAHVSPPLVLPTASSATAAAASSSSGPLPSPAPSTARRPAPLLPLLASSRPLSPSPSPLLKSASPRLGITASGTTSASPRPYATVPAITTATPSLTPPASPRPLSGLGGKPLLAPSPMPATAPTTGVGSATASSSSAPTALVTATSGPEAAVPPTDSSSPALSS